MFQILPTKGASGLPGRCQVPFGEYIPYRQWLEGVGIGRLALIPRDMVRGERTEPLDVGPALVANVICFDVAFDDAVADQVRAGGELVTIQTSNASFIATPQIEQQFAISRIRAMETGRTVVVASVNGLSGAIRPDGTVAEAARPRTQAVLLAEVPLIDDLPPAVRLGEWPAIGLGTLGLGACLFARRHGWTSRRIGASARPQQIRSLDKEPVAYRPHSAVGT